MAPSGPSPTYGGSYRYCGVCLKRCPMDALGRDAAGKVRLGAGRCIGRGLCVSTCAGRSLVVVRKPQAEQREVPATLLQTYLGMARRGGKLGLRALARAWLWTRIKARPDPGP